MGIKSWMEKRKLKKQLSDLRKIELKEIDSYMERVFNPTLVLSKPKYRYRYIPEEKELIRLYMSKVYNPQVPHSYNKNQTLTKYMKGET